MKDRNYIRKDLAGYSFNAKYPPYDGPYEGYSTPNEEILFYDFAVLGYDLQFKYKEQWYYFMNSEDYVALSDENFTLEYQRFNDPIEALEQFKIEGHSLVELVQELEDAEVM